MTTSDGRPGHADAREYLAQLSFAQARLEFCERFDERSEIWNLRKHTHPFFELIFFVDGHANVLAGGDTVVIGGFDVLVYPPGLPHLEHLEIDRRQDIICLWVAAPSPVGYQHPIALPDDTGQLRLVFEQLHAEYTTDRPRRADVIRCYLEVLLLLVQRHAEEPDRLGNRVFERSMAYLHEYYDRQFSIDELAASASVSPSYLFRLFKARLGTAPIHYRNQVRIEKAKLMLLDPHLTVDVVAARVGFDDAKYFTRVFKNVTGLSPRAYRAQQARNVHLPAGSRGAEPVDGSLPSEAKEVRP